MPENSRIALVTVNSESTRGSSAKLFEIDPLRGFVCLSILVMHLYNGRIHAELEQLSGEKTSYAISNIRLGFESFFLLAGFFLAFSFRPSIGNYLSVPFFLVRRFSRLLIPYWIALLLAGLDRALPNWILGHNNHLPSTFEWIAQLLCIQNLLGIPNLNTVFWSVNVLIQIYLLFAACFWSYRRFLLYRKFEKSHIATEIFMNKVMFAAGIASLCIVIMRYHDGTGLIKNCIYVSLGYFVYRIQQNLNSYLPLIILLAGTFFIGFHLHNPRLFASCIASILLLAIARGLRIPGCALKRTLSYIGVRSYSIYLVHCIVGYRILNTANHLSAVTAITAWSLLCVAIVISLAASFTFYWAVEAPLNRLLQSISYRSQ